MDMLPLTEKGYYDALEIWGRTLDLEPLKEFLRQ